MGLINAWKGLFTTKNVYQKRQNLQRIYKAATVDRTTLDWMVSQTSPDQEWKNGIKNLRNRVHDVVINNTYAAQAIRYATNQIVGQGVRMQAQIPKQRANQKGKLDVKTNELIENEWSKWGRRDSCDIKGVLCFSEVERLAVRSMVESGECFIRMHKKRYGRSKVPFALEVIEADMLDQDYQGVKKSAKNTWRLGIELTPEGRAINYAFLTKHPADNFYSAPTGQKQHIIVPAKEVFHIFMPLRPSQHRGIPWLASAITNLHQLEGYIESQVIRARASSALMGFISNSEGEIDAGGEVFQNERVKSFQPGVFHYLNQGEEVTIPNIDASSGDFEPFIRAILRSTASGVGCSYEAISSDYSQSNYSSSRLSLLQDRDNWRTIQQMLKQNFYQPLYEAWLEMAVLSGALNLQQYATMPEMYEKIRWVCRGYSFVDPQREIAAQKDAVRSGFKTLADCINENGGDIDELLVARQDELARLDEMNIITDTDPSATNKSGGSQFKPLNTVDPFGDTPRPSGEMAEDVGDESSGNY